MVCKRTPNQLIMSAFSWLLSGSSWPTLILHVVNTLIDLSELPLKHPGHTLFLQTCLPFPVACGVHRFTCKLASSLSESSYRMQNALNKYMYAYACVNRFTTTLNLQLPPLRGDSFPTKCFPTAPKLSHSCCCW